MTLFFSKWRVRVLKAQIDALREYSAALAAQFQAASSDAEKAKIARRFDKVLKRTHSKQLQLELLERREGKTGSETADV
jgi:predicted metal-binding protein